jgi:hypothetical protein
MQRRGEEALAQEREAVGASTVRTDDLIRALVADHTPRRGTLPQRFLLVSGLGILGALCLYGILLRPRADLMAALTSWPAGFKVGVALSLAAAAGAVAFRQARPEPALGLRAALAPVLALLAVGVSVELATSQPSLWGRSVMASEGFACLLLILALSLAPLAAALVWLRDGAPSRPPLAGAAAGLFAGGVGAALYATHCTNDSPLFVMGWYGLSVAITAVLGAALGRKSLRW